MFTAVEQIVVKPDGLNKVLSSINLDSRIENRKLLFAPNVHYVIKVGAIWL